LEHLECSVINLTSRARGEGISRISAQMLPLQWLASSAARVCLTRHTHLCNSRGHVAGRPSHTDRRFRQNRDRHARAEGKKREEARLPPLSPQFRKVLGMLLRFVLLSIYVAGFLFRRVFRRVFPPGSISTIVNSKRRVPADDSLSSSTDRPCGAPPSPS